MRAPLCRPRLRLSLCALSVCAACSAPHKLISARHTACSVREVEIRDLVSAPNREDWIAVCGERTFACSTRERGRRLIYACRPRDEASHVDAASAPPPASSDSARAGAADAASAESEPSSP